MRQFSTFIIYLTVATLLVVGLADARSRGWRGSNALFDEYGYARSRDSCPIGYIEKCVPDVLNGPYPEVVAASAISSAGGISGSSASASSGFGGGGIQGGGGSFRSMAARRECPDCPPSHVCIPTTGRCIFIWPG